MASKAKPKKPKDIQPGYGSKWHLLRFLGWHGQVFNKSVQKAIGTKGGVEWIDFPFDPKVYYKSQEWKSVDFLKSLGGTAWKTYWPDTSPGNVRRLGMPTWDTIGRISSVEEKVEWVLVEAKAHAREYPWVPKIQSGPESDVIGHRAK